MSRSKERDRGKEPLSTRLLVSWLVNAVVLGIVVAVLRHATDSGVGSLLLAAAVFGILNTVLKPLLRLITLPLALLTFGLAWFFVSMLMLVLTQAVVSGFKIHGFWTFVEATLMIWCVNVLLELIPGPWQPTGRARSRSKLRRTSKS